MSNVLVFAPRPRKPGPVTESQASLIAQGRATHSALNIRTPRVIQIGQGTLCRVFVIAMPSDAVRIYDAARWQDASADNLVATVLALPCQGMFEVNYPCSKGIVIDPGTGGHVTASFN